MSYNFLHLNADKIEVLVIGPQWKTAHVKQALWSLTHISNRVSRNLGVIFDSSLN